MSDEIIELDVVGRDLASAELRAAIAELKQLEAHIEAVSDGMGRAGQGTATYIALLTKLNQEADATRLKIARLSAQLGITAQATATAANEAVSSLNRIDGAVKASGDAWPVWYSKLSRATQQATRDQERFAQVIAGRSSVAGHAREQEEAAKATERLAAAQARFAQTIAPQMNIAQHRRDEATATRDAVQALNSYYNEVGRFNQQIAPQTRVKFVGSGEDLRAVPAALREATAGATNFGLEMRHVVALGDEFARGQRGAIISTLGAAFRDAGVGAKALGAGMALVIPLMGGAALIRGADAMGKMARETQTAALAAGMSVTQFSELQGALQLMGLKVTEANETLRRFAVNVGAAIADPMSTAAEAFKAFGISIDTVKQHAGNVSELFNLVAKSVQHYASDANSARALTELFGRGFERVIPLLSQGSDGLDKARARAHELGLVLNDEAVKALSNTSDKVASLSAAIEGRAIQAFLHWKPAIDSVIDALTRLVGVQSEADKAMQAEQYRAIRTGHGGPTATPMTEGYYTYIGNRRIFHPPEPIPAVDQPYDAIAAAQAFRPSIGPVGTEKKSSEEAVRELALEQSRARDRAAGNAPGTAGLIAENQAELAVMKQGLQNTAIIGDQRLHLQAEIARKEAEIKQEQTNEGARLGKQGEAEARKDFHAFSAEEQNKLALAKGNIDQEQAILQEWRAKAAATYQEGTVDYRNAMSEIEKASRQVQQQVFSANKESVQKQISDNHEILRAFEEDMAAQQKLKQPDYSAQNVIGFDLQKAGQLRAQDISAIQGLYTGDMSKADQDRVDEMLKHVTLQWDVTINSLKEKSATISEAISKSFEKGLAGAFDKIGSGFEHAITAAITRSETGAKIGKQLFSSLVGGAVDMIGNVASRIGAKALGGDGKQGLGDVLAEKMFTFVANQLTQIGLLTSISASTAATAMGAAATAVKPEILGTSYSYGGIVSAAGGMINDGKGGSLSILHPREMVLPANISDHVMRSMGSMQQLFQSNSNSNFTYAPQLHGGSAFESRSGAENFFRRHGSQMEKMIRAQDRAHVRY